MRITFRYTNDEYRQFRQLNRAIATPRWKSYCLALLCLVPSFCLILGTESLIAILAAGTLLVSVLGLAIIAALGDKPIVDKHDHVLTIDRSATHELHSHSQFEASWDYYEQFEESKTFYLLGKLDRFIAIPKRVIEDAQLEEFISYCKQIKTQVGTQAVPGSKVTEQTQEQAVPLFADLFPEANSNNSIGPAGVYQFAYLSDDIAAAMAERLQVVESSSDFDATQQQSKSSPAKRQRLLGRFWLLIFCSILLYIIISAPSRVPLADHWTFGQMVFLMLAIALPFVLMKWLNRWFRSKQKRNGLRVSTEPIFMQLQPSGWAIGNPERCQFFDWRDVEAFFQNKFCFGFHTFDDLVQIIPKRIFATQDEAEQFLDQAVSYRREHRRSFAQTAVAVETGNPYQAPQV